MDIETRNFNTQANVAAYIENQYENTDVYYGDVITNRFLLHVYSPDDNYESIKEDVEKMTLQKGNGSSFDLSCVRVPSKVKELFVVSFNNY